MKFLTEWLWRRQSWRRSLAPSFSFAAYSTPTFASHSWSFSCPGRRRTFSSFSGQTWSAPAASPASPSPRSPPPCFPRCSKKFERRGLRIGTETDETCSGCLVQNQIRICGFVWCTHRHLALLAHPLHPAESHCLPGCPVSKATPVAKLPKSVVLIHSQSGGLFGVVEYTVNNQEMGCLVQPVNSHCYLPCCPTVRSQLYTGWRRPGAQ